MILRAIARTDKGSEQDGLLPAPRFIENLELCCAHNVRTPHIVKHGTLSRDQP